MGKLNVQSGTPFGTAHWCRRCTWGHVVEGYRDSDLLVICMRNDPSFSIPFKVYDCSEFNDKQKPTWEQMTKLAIDVGSVRMSNKTSGFATTVVPIRPSVDEDEDNEVAQLD